MFLRKTLPLVLILLLVSACGTTQDVMLLKATGAKNIRTVKLKPEAGNSAEMDKNLELALAKESIAVKGQVPAYTQKAEGVDAIVSYIDVWRWDLAMYLKSVSVRIYDADSGDMLVLGNWADSPLHGFRDSKLVIEELVKEMMAKIRSAAANK